MVKWVKVGGRLTVSLSTGKEEGVSQECPVNVGGHLSAQ
jgi:hypothetical protein